MVKAGVAARSTRQRKLLVALVLAVATLITLLWRSSHAAMEEADAALLLRSNQDAPRSGGVETPQQIGIAVAVSSQPRHILNLLTMLLPSWNLLRSHPDAAASVLDLLVFCGAGSCLDLPSECRPMRDAGGRLFAHDQVSNCWFTEQDAAANKAWKDYAFMTSITFMMHPEMLRIASRWVMIDPASVLRTPERVSELAACWDPGGKLLLPARPGMCHMFRYDKLMRTDEDVFLTPRLLTWQPPHNAMFGAGDYSDAFNEQRLPQVAAKYGLRHQGVTDIHSTWLAPPQLAIQIANLTLDVGRKLYDKEWDMTLPGLADKVGQEGWEEDGKWPDWWRGVVSMYASELAINHLLPELTPDHVSDELDHWSHESTPISEVVHIHASHDGLLFSKFDFYESLAKLLNASSAQQRRSEQAKQPLVLTDDMQVRYYANALTQQAVRSAAAIAMFAAD